MFAGRAESSIHQGELSAPTELAEGGLEREIFIMRKYYQVRE